MVNEEWGAAQYEAAGWILLDPYRGATKSHRAEHKECGNQDTKKLESIRQGKGCVYCYRAGPMTRLSDDAAFERMVKAVFTPKDREYPGVLTKWLCTCNECGRDVWITLNYAEAAKGAGCPDVCREKRKAEKKAATAARAAERRQKGQEDRGARWKSKRKAQEPEAAALALVQGCTPAEDYPGPDEPWKLTCNACGELFVTTCAYLRRMKKPKACHVQGYDTVRPAYVYVLEHLKTGR
ncbi:hypothetical protein [Streptomyces amritsarensis]|uniref:hypothetical protein n=1 Tax=Streptomyces amritsarensis TaxID=681158 RepID=UPI0036983B08